MSRPALARITGLLYALNIVLGIVGLTWQRQGHPGADAMIIAGAAEYAIVVLLLGRLFEPAGRALSWTVAAIGVAACAVSATVPLHLIKTSANLILVFGPYCIGLGIVIVRSGMMPRIIGYLLVVGGLSWLSFALPDLSHRIAPWNTVVGGLPELILTLWLIAFGVRARAAERS
jgi:hypothetical protein